MAASGGWMLRTKSGEPSPLGLPKLLAHCFVWPRIAVSRSVARYLSTPVVAHERRIAAGAMLYALTEMAIWYHVLVRQSQAGR